MVTMESVLRQFRRLGIKPSFWTKGEVNELHNILVPGEELAHVVKGWYEGGFALLCATNHRVLLVDKKPFFLTVEDLRYDMIVEVKYQYQLMDASVCFTYARKSLDFKSWDKERLQDLVAYVRQCTLEVKLRSDEDYAQRTHLTPAEAPSLAENLPQQVESDKPQTAGIPPELLAPPVETQTPQVPPEPKQPIRSWTRNPYQTSQQLLRRNKASRFVTQSQVNQP
ncbi:MAG: PH domain-containing protein [Candidatus Saccharibacteria bacterium]|nr:PH domain-containing protein [Candidatus Saccharibacteria bacterium]